MLAIIYDGTGVEAGAPCFPVNWVVDCVFMEPKMPSAWASRVVIQGSLDG